MRTNEYVIVNSKNKTKTVVWADIEKGLMIETMKEGESVRHINIPNHIIDNLANQLEESHK